MPWIFSSFLTVSVLKGTQEKIWGAAQLLCGCGSTRARPAAACGGTGLSPVPALSARGAAGEQPGGFTDSAQMRGLLSVAHSCLLWISMEVDCDGSGWISCHRLNAVWTKLFLSSSALSLPRSVPAHMRLFLVTPGCSLGSTEPPLHLTPAACVLCFLQKSSAAWSVNSAPVVRHFSRGSSFKAWFSGFFP